MPFGLLLIDVDRFKRINDQLGHEVGDAVLIRLSKRLRALENRYACLAGRLGGEEFLIGVSGVPAHALEQFADHIRTEIGTSDDGIHPEVTVSIGVAHGTASGPFVALYGKADRALYEAKANGRNRVVFERGVIGHPDQISPAFTSDNPLLR
jgi:diguanylate cyclase (GGDEF)-like protein